MLNEEVANHLSSVHVDVNNVSKESLDGYFEALENREFAYLPDPSASTLDRAIAAIARVASDAPKLAVALTPFSQPHGNYIVVSFTWGGARFDALLPLPSSLQQTAWGTAESVARFLEAARQEGIPSGAVSIETADPPEWAEHGFLLLVGVPPEGRAIGEDLTAADFEDHQVVVPGGELQGAASSLHGHHTLHGASLTDDERKALLTALGVTVADKVIPISLLLAVGDLNPFASQEDLVLRSTIAGVVLLGGVVAASPAFTLRAAPTEENSDLV